MLYYEYMRGPLPLQSTGLQLRIRNPGQIAVMLLDNLLRLGRERPAACSSFRPHPFNEARVERIALASGACGSGGGCATKDFHAHE